MAVIRRARGSRHAHQKPRPSARRDLSRAVLAKIEQCRAPLRLYARFAPYLGAELYLLGLTAVAMLGTTLLTLARPWPMQVIVDSVLGGRPAPWWISWSFRGLDRPALLAVATGLMIGTLLLGHVLALCEQYFSQLLGQRMVRRLRCDLYVKLQRLSLRFYDRSSVGDLIHRITVDTVGLQDVVTYGFVPLAVQFLTAIAIAGTVFALDARLGAAVVALVPLLVLWTMWFSEAVRRHARGLATAESGLYVTASEVLGGIRAVKSFAMEEVELRRFERHARSSQEAYVRVMTLSALGALVTEALAGVGVAVAVYLGARAVLGGGRLTVGELLVFIAYLHSLYGPITQVAASATVIQRSAASIERVVQIFDQEDEYVRPGGIRLKRVEGSVSYQDVWTTYGDGQPVLRGVTLDVAPGERVAVVGRSGVGKTTLVSLLLRFYGARGGRILLDGHDVETMDLTWLRQQIALVLQEPIIFSGTLAENIAYGRPDANPAEVVAASRAADLHEFVMSLPGGYDTAVGERGVRLSGGERQRVAIARAFLKKAPILILDEPTSNLDATTERQIFESLDRLAGGRTTLLIAHRLATVQRADRIVVLVDGRIAESGTHAALLTAGGAYARLWEDQGAQRPPSGESLGRVAGEPLPRPRLAG